MNKLITSTGFLLLLMAAYFDNLRGPLLPIFNSTLKFQYGKSSYLLSIGYLAALLTLLILTISSKRIGDKSFAVFFLILTFILSLFSQFVINFYSFIIFSAMLGSVIAGFGVLSNVFVIRGTKREYLSRSLSLLHTMYGIGSAIAPITIGYLFKLTDGYWQSTLFIFIPIVFLSFILITKIPSENTDTTVERKKLNYLQITVILLFAIYVAGEVTTSMWLTPYLVSGCGLKLEHATKYASLFFIMMALTRLLFFLFPCKERAILCGSLILSIFFFFLGRNGILWCFPLAGILGPFFPLLLSRVSKNFPAESRYLTFIILTVVQLVLSINQLFLGKLTDFWGINRSYWIPFYILILALFITSLYLIFEIKYFKGKLK